MPRARIVSERRFRPDAEQLLPAGRIIKNQRSAVGLAAIAVANELNFPRTFSGNVLIVPLDITVGLPHVLARLLVEGNRVLQIDAVEREDYKVVEQDD